LSLWGSALPEDIHISDDLECTRCVSTVIATRYMYYWMFYLLHGWSISAHATSSDSIAGTYSLTILDNGECYTQSAAHLLSGL